jgi:ABC-2 type transport system permease protein
VVKVLQSDDLADLVEVSLAPDEAAARAAIDSQQAQVAVIIPTDFSRTFAETDQQAVIEFYQDPALTIGPRVVNSILSQFMDGMAGINITVDLAVDQAPTLGEVNVGRVISQFLSTYQQQDSDLSASMLEVVTPGRTPREDENQLLKIIGPIMGGMMIFYAFYTGTSSAESILKEEEEHTLQRLFTTPTPQATILSGKLLAVFITVFVQVIVLLIAARLIFRIEWGEFPSVMVTAVGIVLSASSFGIFINSLLKDTKQGGVVFGGVMTITGMIGMLPIFTGGSLTDSFTAQVSLTVPQGWAGHGMLQSMQGEPFSAVCLSALVMLAWSMVFFSLGVWRFNRRYA